MRQISTTAFLGMLALTITGCPSSNAPQTISPPPSIAPVVQTPPSAKPPLIAQNPSAPTQLAPGLIQPTNANQRTKQVAKGNRDPFTALFLPVPIPPINAGNTASVPTQTPQIVSSPTVSSRQTTRTQTSSKNVNNRQSKPNSIAINNPRTTLNPRSSSSSTATTNQNSTPLPTTTLPNTNLQPALPPAMPEPELAKGVTVMGVIQIGEQTQAIVQVPNEATSRYVQVGQRLSNGQVLVKRIELNEGAEPLIILEQYGVEVSKAVGEIAPSQGQATPTAELPVSSHTSTPTAAVPYLPPQSNRTPTAELPAPPPNINVSGINISVPPPLSNPPVKSAR